DEQAGVEGDAENLAAVAEGAIFAARRRVRSRRHRMLSWLTQLLTAAGMLATLALVAHLVVRHITRRVSAERQRTSARLEQERQAARQASLRQQAPTLNDAARQRCPDWALTDESCYELLLSLNTVADGDSALTRLWFDEWVQADTALCGLLGAHYQRIERASEIEPACQRLAGMTIGLSGEDASLAWMERFREAVACKLKARP
ncbi:MAG: hypothetical protein PHR35_07140, partial [Kiritimatiellae bacterium]|nr:hypothetical protein [Kiritimatiellia bacterium]